MKKTKKRNRFFAYIKDSFKELINSFKKLNIQLLFVIVMDLLFFVLSYAVFFVLAKILANQALKLQGFSMDFIELEQTQAAMRSFQNFLYIFLVFFILLVVFMLFNWSFFKYSIWNLVIKGKILLKGFWTFVLANLVWFLIWLVPFIFTIYPFFVMAKAQLQLQSPPLFPIVIFFILLVALIHFTYLYFIGFIKEHKISKAIAFAFRTGTVKIRYLLLPYFFILVGLFILSLITYPLNFISNKISLAISLVVLLAYVGWIRFYISKIVLAIK